MIIFLGSAIVIPPLQTIQVQMINICKEWKIPYLNISELSTKEDVQSKLEAVKPKVIICSIEDINKEEIQASLQLQKISYIAIDECQVR